MIVFDCFSVADDFSAHLPVFIVEGTDACYVEWKSRIKFWVRVESKIVTLGERRSFDDRKDAGIR